MSAKASPSFLAAASALFSLIAAREHAHFAVHSWLPKTSVWGRVSTSDIPSKMVWNRGQAVGQSLPFTLFSARPLVGEDWRRRSMCPCSGRILPLRCRRPKESQF